jgi:hypothetical protein
MVVKGYGGTRVASAMQMRIILINDGKSVPLCGVAS